MEKFHFEGISFNAVSATSSRSTRSSQAKQRELSDLHQATRLTTRWVVIGLSVAAVPPAVAALGTGILAHNSAPGQEIGTFFGFYFAGEILALPPTLLLAVVLRWVLPRAFGRDLRRLKAVFVGAIVGMLCPHVLFFSTVALTAFDTSGKAIDWTGLAHLYALVLVFAAPIAMVVTTLVGVLIGWVVGKILSVRLRWRLQETFH